MKRRIRANYPQDNNYIFVIDGDIAEGAVVDAKNMIIAKMDKRIKNPQIDIDDIRWSDKQLAFEVVVYLPRGRKWHGEFKFTRWKEYESKEEAEDHLYEAIRDFVDDLMY